MGLDVVDAIDLAEATSTETSLELVDALASAAYAAVPRGTRRVRAGVPTDHRPPFRGASGRVKTGVNVID